jgi:hypothetical protein
MAPSAVPLLNSGMTEGLKPDWNKGCIIAAGYKLQTEEIRILLQQIQQIVTKVHLNCSTFLVAPQFSGFSPSALFR